MTTVTISDAKCVHATAKAILVRAPALDEDTWVPKSQRDDDSEVYGTGTDGKLIVSEWFARQRGWV